MGFSQCVVISSVVDPSTRSLIEDSAKVRWPFLRSPRDAGRFSDRAMIAPPETTDYLFPDEAAYERAVEFEGQIQDELPQFSKQFPGVTFAFIEAECFGGVCLYTGYCCLSGEEVFTLRQSEKDGDIQLLLHVGIDGSNSFAPLTRGFFDQ